GCLRCRSLHCFPTRRSSDLNGHGLIRSVGDTGAFKTSIYYVFEQYRRWMTGHVLPVDIEGPGVKASDMQYFLDGDAAKIKMDSRSEERRVGKEYRSSEKKWY